MAMAMGSYSFVRHRSLPERAPTWANVAVHTTHLDLGAQGGPRPCTPVEGARVWEAQGEGGCVAEGDDEVAREVVVVRRHTARAARRAAFPLLPLARRGPARRRTRNKLPSASAVLCYVRVGSAAAAAGRAGRHGRCRGTPPEHQRRRLR